MKQRFFALLFMITGVVAPFGLLAQQTPVFGDIGNGKFRNPVIPSDYSDPDIIRVGDDYYGIASTFCFSPGMIVIHSRDLVNWEIINHVVDDITFLHPDLDWTKMKGYFNGIWAGSLRYHQGVFYCHFATPRGGWFVATTKDIRGKWDVQAMKDSNGRELRGRGWDDLCPLWDDDGQAYIIASNFGKRWFPHIYKMSWDGTQLLDGLIDKDSDMSKNMEIIGGYVVKPFRTAEASKLYKWNGMYYIYFSEVRNIHGNRVRVPVMRRSKSIYGPYDEQLLMHSQGKSVDKEPNQGSIIDTKDGGWYFVTHHGTGDFDGRVLSVLPVNWKDNWPHIGKDSDNDGVGEMVWEMQKPLYGQEAMEIQTSDFFDSSQLGHQWEFNHQPRHDKWSLHERKGFLRLHAFSQLRKDDFFSTGNVLSQRYIRWGKGEAVAKFDIRNMSEGQEAGLAHFNGGKDYACIVVAKNNGKLQLLYKTKSGKVSEQIVLSENLSNRQRSLWFKTEIDFSGKATFAWSTNGKSYKTCGAEYQLKWGSYRGDRIGLFTYNNLHESGYVDVDYMTYENRTIQ
jgi:beta-xylosidase